MMVQVFGLLSQDGRRRAQAAAGLGRGRGCDGAPPPPGALAAVAACSVSLNGELIHPSSVFNYECEGGKEVTVELEIANAGTNDQVIKTSMLPRDEASAQAFQFLTKAGTVTGGTDIESKVRAGGRHCPQGITMQV
jgi:hypothetical protein